MKKTLAICLDVWYYNQAVKNTAPWSRGQDASLSRWNQGFDSPRSHF